MGRGGIWNHCFCGISRLLALSSPVVIGRYELVTPEGLRSLDMAVSACRRSARVDQFTIAVANSPYHEQSTHIIGSYSGRGLTGQTKLIFNLVNLVFERSRRLASGPGLFELPLAGRQALLESA